MIPKRVTIVRKTASFELVLPDLRIEVFDNKLTSPKPIKTVWSRKRLKGRSCRVILCFSSGRDVHLALKATFTTAPKLTEGSQTAELCVDADLLSPTNICTKCCNADLTSFASACPDRLPKSFCGICGSSGYKSEAGLREACQVIVPSP